MKPKSLLVACSLLSACNLTVFTTVEPRADVTATDRIEIIPEPSADVLFVIDDSGSMEEEQFNLMANLSRFIETLQETDAKLRFATITTNTKGAANQSGDFFIRPIGGGGQFISTRDTRDRDGVIRDIPDEFCDEVLARSANGVLDSENVLLQSLINENNIAGDLDPIQPGIQILDFMGRAPGTVFIDADNDPLGRPERPSQIITATFIDEVGCILAVGVEGSGFEAGLCKIAASLDKDSLSGKNAAFLSNPDSVLATIIVGDEDDCTLQMTGDSTVSCGVPDTDPVAVDRAGSLLCSQPSSEDICGTGVTGQSDNLVSASIFSDLLKGLRREDKLFVATIVGPPTIPVAVCGAQLPEVAPSCEAAATGRASPGNRFLSFTSEFTNTVDSFSETQEDTDEHLADGICGDFDNALGKIAEELAALVDLRCTPNAPIDTTPGGFDIERDMRVVVDLSETGFVCADITVDTSISNGESGAQIGDPVTVPLNEAQTRCEIIRDTQDGIQLLRLEATTTCSNGFRLEFVDFALPDQSKLTLEYISSPD
jgi:hypothetical protein